MIVYFCLIRDVQSGFIRRDWLENPPLISIYRCFFSYKPPCSSGTFHWLRRLMTAEAFFGFDPEANGRNPKNHMVETNQPGWWFGTWLLFFYIYIIIIHINIYIYIYKLGMS